jgi:TRAP-type transport system periplasmic protein
VTRTWAALVLLTATATATATAHAEPKFVLRMATVAPDGTGFARELRSLSREVAEATGGAVQLKWYWGGIAGDDAQIVERVARGQLDGVASGVVCQVLAPTFRAVHVPGLYRSRDEIHYVLGQLWDDVVREFRASGYQLLAFGVLGAVDVFSRHPVRTLDELKHERLWAWDADVMLRAPLAELGLALHVAPLDAAGRAYTDGRSDGFLTIPSATLMYQWYTQAHYLSELRVNFLTGCVAIATRAFDRLPSDYQQVLRGATAKMSDRLERHTQEQDAQLVGGVFSKQGVEPVPVSDAFRDEFAAAALAAVERMGARLIAPALLARAEKLVAHYRATHGAK